MKIYFRKMASNKHNELRKTENLGTAIFQRGFVLHYGYWNSEGGNGLKFQSPGCKYKQDLCNLGNSTYIYDQSSGSIQV